MLYYVIVNKNRSKLTIIVFIFDGSKSYTCNETFYNVIFVDCLDTSIHHYTYYTYYNVNYMGIYQHIKKVKLYKSKTNNGI